MRMRNVKGAKEAVDSHHRIIRHPEDHKGRWHRFFNNNHPIHIEIGMGKGQFISTLAHENPSVNYIGIEKFSGVLHKAIGMLDALAVDNLVCMRLDAIHLCDVFNPGEIERIYLNFSDPWPKERHLKRRLTYDDFLKVYATLLKDQGALEFKTDNAPLFDFSLEQLKSSDFKIAAISRDLHKDYDGPVVTTEYEDKFVSMGMPIHYLEARKG